MLYPLEYLQLGSKTLNLAFVLVASPPQETFSGKLSAAERTEDLIDCTRTPFPQFFFDLKRERIFATEMRMSLIIIFLKIDSLGQDQDLYLQELGAQRRAEVLWYSGGVERKSDIAGPFIEYFVKHL